MAAAPCSCGIAAIGNPTILTTRLRKGRPQIHPARREAARQLGAGADEAATATAAKRTNWLLIKHRDEIRQRGQRPTTSLTRIDRSHPADRWIRSRKARGKRQSRSCWPRAAKTKADAVWHSNRGEAAEARAKGKRRRLRDPRATRKARAAVAKKVDAMPDFVAPRALRLGRAAAQFGRTGVMKSSSTATGCSCGSRTATAVLKTRKALDWTDKFRRDRQGRRSALPDALIDGEIVALNHARRSGFLGAAGGDIRRQDRISHFLRVRSAVRRR